MTSDTPKHRHLLAGPLCLGLLCISMMADYSGELRTLGATVRAPVMIDQDPVVTMMDPQTIAQLQSGSLEWEGDDARLVTGEILVSGSSDLSLYTDNWHLVGFDGAFFAVSQGGVITVAALSTPVVVSSEDLLQVVPVGWQWKEGAEMTAIPSNFFRRQLQHLSALPEVTDIDIADLGSDSVTTLVHLLHPEHRDRVRAQVDKSAFTALEMESYLYAFPYADERSVSLSAELYSRWIYDWEQVLVDREDAGEMVALLIEQTAHLITRAAERGYPTRAERLRSALLRIAEGRGVGDAVLDLIAVSEEVVLEEKVKEVVDLDEVEEIFFELMPPEILARTEQALRSAGAAYLLSTSVSPLPPSSARIEQIVFSSPSGDRLISFDLDLQKMEVSRIQIGETIYPNTMSFEGFVSWVRS